MNTKYITQARDGFVSHIIYDVIHPTPEGRFAMEICKIAAANPALAGMNAEALTEWSGQVAEWMFRRNDARGYLLHTPDVMVVEPKPPRAAFDPRVVPSDPPPDQHNPQAATDNLTDNRIV